MDDWIRYSHAAITEAWQELIRDILAGRAVRLTINARANAVTRYFEAGMVYFVGREAGGVGEILLNECEDQLLTFPRGKHDDLVDVTVYGIMRLTGLAEIVGEMETVVIDDRVEISPV